MVSCHTSQPYKRSNLSSPSQSFERQRRCHCAPPITFRVLAWLIVVQLINQPICNTNQFLYDPYFIRPNFYMTLILYTIACLTGYPQDMCVAPATHGPQACTLWLCVRSHRIFDGDKVVKRPYFCRANNRNLVLRCTAAVYLAQTVKKCFIKCSVEPIDRTIILQLRVN